jgi:hypothetical protein
MNIGYAIAAFFGGWCGSVPISVIIQWLLRHGGNPPPPPPDPWYGDWFLAKVIGAVAGVVTAYIYAYAFGPQPEPWRDSVFGAAVFSFVGFLGGRFVSELFGVVRGKSAANVNRA